MIAPPPPGFVLDAPPEQPKRAKRPILTLRDPFADYRATGEVVDGDTIRVDDGLTARLLGLDAFESGQLGYRKSEPLRLGELARMYLSGRIKPEQQVSGTGKQTFGRPVVTLGSGRDDPGVSMLLQGFAVAAPEYLDDDPERRGEYLEAERLGRLNRQGANQTERLTPEAHRRAQRWGVKLRPDEEMVWTNDLPELRPEFQRMTDEEERDYFAFLASKSGDQTFGQADLDAYWKDKGKAAEQADAKFIEAIRKGDRIGNIDYSSWDAQTLRDFQMANGFAGLRPEVRQAYEAVLSNPDADAAALQQFADVNGLTFDPRDVEAFFAARARGENPNVPIPIINPGDGKSGALGRGLADPLGFLDEAGGVVDSLAPRWLQEAVSDNPQVHNRENVWDSDRSFGEIYDNNTRQNRAIIDYDETHHPIMRAGGQLASGFLLPYGGGIRGAANLAKAGAAEGAVYGYASGDGTVAQRLANVPLNAAGGGILGGALGKGAELVKGVTGRFANVLRLRGGDKAADQEWVAAFQTALQQQVGDDASDISESQLRAAFDAADDAAEIATARQALPDGFVMDGPAVANMDAEDALPSLSSPRVPDTIDVNAARTARMMDGPTEAMINAATARVDPADVLPRPANEIQSLDEAAAISEGLYPEVKAPRERDVLETRQFPSRANPDNMLNRRGPLDLAAFVRAEGGVADFRGELKAAGLSNAPRRGDDFAGGENRLGPLLNDESGSTLDDMAQRAWEAGYFPDHATRPTIDEFVTALEDTYRGINRTFRPDDFAEIDAFNAARDQRLAVERARQEGAPLADDIGQPATLDDMIANTPPATAYDDWNNAVVAKVGNIDVRKLESPQDIGQALKVADNVAGGFDAARRGKISFAETRALAQDLGMTADDLLARRKGQAFSAEEAYAARAILAKSGNELVNMAKRIRSLGIDPGSEALAAFRKALVRHTAIQEQFSGMTAEAGRALSAFRVAADSRDIPGRVLEGLANAGGGTGRLIDAAERIIDLERDPANLNRFVEKVSKPKFADRAQEVWYNYLLSGPQTHMVNMLSNTLTALGQIPEHAVAAGLGSVRRAIGGLDSSDRVLFSELGARTVGLLQGTKEGVREFARAFRTGEASDFVTKMESQTQKAVPGIKGELLRVPTRLLTAEDELFKAMARRMELSGLAVRQAAKEGLRGQEAKDRIGELMANPTDDMMEKVLDYGRYLTFQRPLGDGLAGTLSRYSQNHPLIKAVLPFIRTPTNLIKFTAERSPLAPLVKEWRKDFGAGGARRDLAVAKAMVGSGIGAVIAELAAKGIVTGSAPSDDNQRNLMMANGWQPYSFKIGDTYYSYRRLDPFAMTFGTAADIATMGEGMTEKQREKGAALWAASVVSNLASRTWLSGITDALEAVQDPERYSGNFFKRLVGSATVPTGAAQLARIVDPTMRETPDAATYMSSRMPGQSDELLPKRDIWGRAIVSEGGIGPDILSPIWTTDDKKDPITLEALRVGATISKLQKGDLTPEQYDRLQEVAGSVGRQWIGQLITTPEYQALDTDSQADEIKDVMTKARKAAKANVLSGEPIPDDRPVKKRRGRSAPPPPPPGFVIDPPPAGFVLDQ